MILRLIEGSLVPVACMDDEPNQCPRSEECVTLDVWRQIDEAISAVVDNITLADLVAKQKAKRPS
jgi:DNA-binding IscR family transcriptional regulator